MGVALNLSGESFILNLLVKNAQSSLALDFPPALLFLGKCFHKGIGTSKDPVEAFRNYMKAAERGLALAQTHVGKCYRHGFGTERNTEKSLVWFHKAAAQDDHAACFELGVSYQRGLGTAKNFDEALKWYQKAADLGSVDAKKNIVEFAKEIVNSRTQAGVS